MNDELEQFLASLPVVVERRQGLRRLRGDSAKRAAEDFLQRLEDRRRSRAALVDPFLDGLRFRWWFTHSMGKDLSLDDWRELIDQRIRDSEG